MIRGLARESLDALTADEKRVLQGAAIVGRVFWEQPLARTAGDLDVRRSLLELETQGMIYARAGSTLAGQTEYTFKHALLRDVAYAAVPKARRARAHAQVGKWIEELARDRRTEFAELLAYHFEAASAGDGAELAWGSAAERETVRATALEHLMFAGVQARARYAISSALDLHARALAIASTDPERRRAQEELGDDHDSTFAGESAVSAYRSALELAADRQDRVAGAFQNYLATTPNWLRRSSPCHLAIPTSGCRCSLLLRWSRSCWTSSSTTSLPGCAPRPRRRSPRPFSNNHAWRRRCHIDAQR